MKFASHSTFKQISYLLINDTPWLSSNIHMAPSLQGDNTLDLKCDIFVDLVRELENLLGEGDWSIWSHQPPVK
jgi:hypothetical protein